MKKKEFKVGDLVTIKSFDPESAWNGSNHLIGIVYEKVEDVLEYSRASGYHKLQPISKDYSGCITDGQFYPRIFGALCTLEHLL